MPSLPTPLVSAKWLMENIKDANLIILDASIKKVTAPENEDNQVRIPGARFFDLSNAFSDPNSEFPNTWPSTEQFQVETQKLGINNDSKVVVYDDKGIYSSARAWYMLSTFGHQNVSVLDGGLPNWIEQGYSTEAIEEEKYDLGDFIANFDSGKVLFFDDMKKKVEQKTDLILDARSADRFYGKVPEPRKGLRQGIIPGSKSLPFTDVQNDHYMKSPIELRRIFHSFPNEANNMIFSCGSGVTACVLALGAEIAGIEDYSVYDGSWTEWGTLTT